ncbi:hypothetical protein [Ferviditalea candida]|uniref:DUF5671 domain-containing protein n=1 Tax=Ferviditalea candida TaxID=3108399 RepID=A0ABU5ZEE0_9BACL|nr:hypothetical protein [Paenibacillaceae bacterium T2]
MSILIISAVVLSLIMAVVIIVTVSVRARNHPADNEGGEIMFKTLYIYLVLFATLMMSIGGSVAAFMAIADIVSPPSYYQSFEMYKQGQLNMPKEAANQQKVPTEAELKQNYDQMVNDELQRARERAVNSLIKSFGWIIIPFPIFIYFQRKVRNA